MARIIGLKSSAIAVMSMYAKRMVDYAVRMIYLYIASWLGKCQYTALLKGLQHERYNQHIGK
jgi:hypothetical protein